MCRLDNIGPKSPGSEMTGLRCGEAGPEKLSETGSGGRSAQAAIKAASHPRIVRLSRKSPRKHR